MFTKTACGDSRTSWRQLLESKATTLVENGLAACVAVGSSEATARSTARKSGIAPLRPLVVVKLAMASVFIVTTIHFLCFMSFPLKSNFRLLFHPLPFRHPGASLQSNPSSMQQSDILATVQNSTCKSLKSGFLILGPTDAFWPPLCQIYSIHFCVVVYY